MYQYVLELSDADRKSDDRGVTSESDKDGQESDPSSTADDQDAGTSSATDKKRRSSLTHILVYKKRTTLCER